MPKAWDSPDAFVGRATLSAYEPWPIVTGSQYSSVNPASVAVVHWVQPTPIAASNVVVLNTMNVGVPGATSQASTGSLGYSYALSAFMYSRQDYTANSSNLAFVNSGSFGMTASLGYSSTSQVYGLSWVTNTSGGTSNTTVSSADAGWSNFASGIRVLNVPLQTTLTAGEYWMMFQHSSSSASSVSNVTLQSMSLLQQVQANTFAAGFFGASTTVGAALGPGQNVGVVAAPLTTNATMPLSAVTASFRAPIWFAMGNT